jgi:hypothetical protein
MKKVTLSIIVAMAMSGGTSLFADTYYPCPKKDEIKCTVKTTTPTQHDVECSTQHGWEQDFFARGTKPSLPIQFTFINPQEGHHDYHTRSYYCKFKAVFDQKEEILLMHKEELLNTDPDKIKCWVSKDHPNGWTCIEK